MEGEACALPEEEAARFTNEQQESESNPPDSEVAVRQEMPASRAPIDGEITQASANEMGPGSSDTGGAAATALEAQEPIGAQVPQAELREVEPPAPAPATAAAPARAAASSSFDDEDDDEPVCRICRDGVESGKLYCPCRCSGSIKYIHESCLKTWLFGSSAERRPICELCHHPFTFTPVYADDAPPDLTPGDWLGWLATATLDWCFRGLRVVYAILLWCFVLPLLTVAGNRFMFLGQANLPAGAHKHAITLLLNIFLGEYLCLAGVSMLYLVSLIRPPSSWGGQASPASTSTTGLMISLHLQQQQQQNPSEQSSQQRQQQQQQQQQPPDLEGRAATAPSSTPGLGPGSGSGSNSSPAVSFSVSFAHPGAGSDSTTHLPGFGGGGNSISSEDATASRNDGVGRVILLGFPDPSSNSNPHSGSDEPQGSDSRAQHQRSWNERLQSVDLQTLDLHSLFEERNENRSTSLGALIEALGLGHQLSENPSAQRPPVQPSLPTVRDEAQARALLDSLNEMGPRWPRAAAARAAATSASSAAAPFSAALTTAPANAIAAASVPATPFSPGVSESIDSLDEQRVGEAVSTNDANEGEPQPHSCSGQSLEASIQGGDPSNRDEGEHDLTKDEDCSSTCGELDLGFAEEPVLSAAPNIEAKSSEQTVEDVDFAEGVTPAVPSWKDDARPSVMHNGAGYGDNGIVCSQTPDVPLEQESGRDMPGQSSKDQQIVHVQETPGGIDVQQASSELSGNQCNTYTDARKEQDTMSVAPAGEPQTEPEAEEVLAAEPAAATAAASNTESTSAQEAPAGERAPADSPGSLTRIPAEAQMEAHSAVGYLPSPSIEAYPDTNAVELLPQYLQAPDVGGGAPEAEAPALAARATEAGADGRTMNLLDVPATDEELEEDLWTIVGLQGNPLRALFSMMIIFIANMVGVFLFLRLPLCVGRQSVNHLVFPWLRVQALSESSASASVPEPTIAGNLSWSPRMMSPQSSPTWDILDDRSSSKVVPAAFANSNTSASMVEVDAEGYLKEVVDDANQIWLQGEEQERNQQEGGRSRKGPLQRSEAGIGAAPTTLGRIPTTSTATADTGAAASAEEGEDQQAKEGSSESDVSQGEEEKDRQNSTEDRRSEEQRLGREEQRHPVTSPANSSTPSMATSPTGKEAEAPRDANSWTSFILTQELPAIGEMPSLDLVLIVVGYCCLTCYTLCFLIFCKCIAQLAGRSNSDGDFFSTTLTALLKSLLLLLEDGFWKLKLGLLSFLQKVVLPATIGHGIVVFLCGPVFHISQQERSEICATHSIMSLVVNLLLGYIHLWAAAFIEGCVAAVLTPALSRRFSENFYAAALFTHRYLFTLPSVLDVASGMGSGDAHGAETPHPGVQLEFVLAGIDEGDLGSPPPRAQPAAAEQPDARNGGSEGVGAGEGAGEGEDENGGPEAQRGLGLTMGYSRATLTLLTAVWHGVVHLPLSFLVWYFPALALNWAFGEALFPLRLGDHSGVWGAGLASGSGPGAVAARARIEASRRELLLSAGLAPTNAAGSAPGTGPLEGQAVFTMEMLQLSFVVLQCAYLLTTSSSLTRMVTAICRTTFRRAGLLATQEGVISAAAAAETAPPISAEPELGAGAATATTAHAASASLSPESNAGLGSAGSPPETVQAALPSATATEAQQTEGAVHVEGGPEVGAVHLEQAVGSAPAGVDKMPEPLEAKGVKEGNEVATHPDEEEEEESANNSLAVNEVLDEMVEDGQTEVAASETAQEPEAPSPSATETSDVARAIEAVRARLAQASSFAASDIGSPSAESAPHDPNPLAIQLRFSLFSRESGTWQQVPPTAELLQQAIQELRGSGQTGGATAGGAGTGDSNQFEAQVRARIRSGIGSGAGGTGRTGSRRHSHRQDRTRHGHRRRHRGSESARRESSSQNEVCPEGLFGKLSLVFATFLVIAWGVMMVVLAAPLVVGRLSMRILLASQAPRISDLLPLSVGVVFVSFTVVLGIKTAEALPMICGRLANMENRRILHLVACSCSTAWGAFIFCVAIPLGTGSLLLKLAMPLRVHSVFQVPILFAVTDSWTLGVVLAKMIWRVVQSDLAFHQTHLLFTSIWMEADYSFTNLFFDLRSHARLWRSILSPLMQELAVHLLFPEALALTIIPFLPEDWHRTRATILMYCYHCLLSVRIVGLGLPWLSERLSEARQKIFDAKYLVSRELQNYHPMPSPP